MYVGFKIATSSEREDVTGQWPGIELKGPEAKNPPK